jgi:hypothetical protein
VNPRKLPLWRAIAGFGVLFSLFAVLFALAPVYLDNYQLTSYIKGLATDSRISRVPDEMLRNEVIDRAHRLQLPLEPGQVEITHPGGKLHVEMKYVVQKDLALYRVDLHFHPTITQR